MSRRSRKKQQKMRIQLDSYDTKTTPPVMTDVPEESTESTTSQENTEMPEDTLSLDTASTVEESPVEPQEEILAQSEPALQETQPMEPNEPTDVTIREEKPSKTGAIIAIVFGIILILAGWGVYTYFNDSASKQGDIGESAQTDRDSELANVNRPELPEYSGIIVTQPNQQTGGVAKNTPLPIIIQDQANQKPPQIQEKQAEKQEQQPRINTTVTVQEPSVKSTQTGAWVANDYQKGDISGPTYTVVRGDTLWEIAEAVYGNGSEWHKIADANDVGTLSNGNPLIIPGQVLTIP